MDNLLVIDKVKNKSGIYVLINLKNLKIYLGKAENLYSRKSCHFSQLKKNLHGNKELQEDYNLFGKDSFNFKVLEYVKEEDELNERERFWYDLFNYAERLYNVNGFREKTEVSSVDHSKITVEQYVQIVLRDSAIALTKKEIYEKVKQLRVVSEASISLIISQLKMKGIIKSFYDTEAFNLRPEIKSARGVTVVYALSE